MTKKRIRRPHLPTKFEIEMVPFYISEEEDRERIERLTRMILRIVRDSRKSASQAERESDRSIEKML